MDSGCRSVGRVRQNRPSPASRRARIVPRQGHDRAVAEGRGDRERRVHTDRGGFSPRRCDQSVVDERGAARAGGGRGSPLPQFDRARRCGGSGHSDPGEIRRRPGRLLLLPGAGRAGQGAACRVAGSQGSGLQRGQDAHRPPR